MLLIVSINPVSWDDFAHYKCTGISQSVERTAGMIAAVKASAIANWVSAAAFMVSLVGKPSLSFYQHI